MKCAKRRAADRGCSTNLDTPFDRFVIGVYLVATIFVMGVAVMLLPKFIH